MAASSTGPISGAQLLAVVELAAKNGAEYAITPGTTPEFLDHDEVSIYDDQFERSINVFVCRLFRGDLFFFTDILRVVKLLGMFSRTIRLLESGIKPLYVFDGKPPELKSQELAKCYTKRADATEDLAQAIETGNKEDIEKFRKRTVKVTKQPNYDCKKLLRLARLV